MATWNNNPGGAWGNSLEWSGNVSPNGVDAVGDFYAIGGASLAVDLRNGPFTVGTLNLFNAVFGGFSFQNGTLVMQSSSGSAQIHVQTDNNLQPDFFNNGTLQLNSNTIVNTVGSATFSSLSGISGTGGLEKTGTGTMTLGGANTYAGPTFVLNGILNLQGTLASSTTITGGQMILVSGADIADGSSITVSGFGTLTVNAFDTVASVFQTGGTIEGSFTLTTNTYTQFGGVLDGVLSASGTKTLNGGTISGTLQGAGATIIQTGTTTVTGTIAGDVSVATSGTLHIDGSTAVSGTITAQGSTISYADLASEDSEIILSATGTNFNVFGTDAATQSGVISQTAGSMGLNKTGTGTLTLSGSNTYTGLTTVSAGTLIVTNATALGTTVSGTTVGNGATLAVQGGITVAEAITLNGTGVSGGGALRSLGGSPSNDVSGMITLATDARINSDANQLNIIGGITGNDTNLTVGGTAYTFIASAITTGTGSLTVDATTANGVVTLGGANTFTGGTTVNSGFLQLSGGSALADTGALTINALGTVQVIDGETVGALSGSGTITLQTAGALVAGAATNTVFSGTIGEFAVTGAFTKAGTGTLTLSGANTYTGTTTVTGGTLALSGAGSLANSDLIQLFAGSTFDISGTTTGATLKDLYSNGGLANLIIGGKSLTLTGVIGILGALNVTGGTGTDALSITLASTLANFSLAGVAFANWTAGVDTIRVTGNALVNTLTGDTNDNILDGGVDTVVDTLIGGNGNDTYVLGAGGDIVNDTSGIDTITSSIGRNMAFYAAIENLTLTGAGNINGTGNALANRITGNGGNNILNGGVDTVTDTLIGGAGDDTYVLGSGGDIVSDTSGIDTIQSSVSRNLGFYTTIENLTLTGTGNINGTGNALANRITGTSGDNILNGGTDAVTDTLIGGAGNDTYVLGAGGDIVNDASGIDTIQSSVSRNLGFYAAVENLTLTGTGNINGTGNSLANRIAGTSGNNFLDGGLGSDILTGGAGFDTFVFSTALSPTNIDRINDYNVANDTIRVDNAVFTTLALGNLAATAFASNTTGLAGDASDRIIYESDTGKLFYDADGLGGAAGIHFATLTAGLALTQADFVVF